MKIIIDRLECDLPNQPNSDMLITMKNVLMSLKTQSNIALEFESDQYKNLVILSVIVSYISKLKQIQELVMSHINIYQRVCLTILDRDDIYFVQSSVYYQHIFDIEKFVIIEKFLELKQVTIIITTKLTQSVKQLSQDIKKLGVKNIPTISLISRQNLCFQTLKTNLLDVEDSLDIYCSYLVKNQLCQYKSDKHILLQKDNYSRQCKSQIQDIDELVQFTREKQICPYYFNQSYLEQADIIFCTYKYFFDERIPNIAKQKQIVLIINEQNDFIQTCCDQYNFQLNIKDIQKLIIAIKQILKNEYLPIVQLFQNIIKVQSKFVDIFQQSIVDAKLFFEHINYPVDQKIIQSFKNDKNFYLNNNFYKVLVISQFPKDEQVYFKILNQSGQLIITLVDSKHVMKPFVGKYASIILLSASLQKQQFLEYNFSTTFSSLIYVKVKSKNINIVEKVNDYLLDGSFQYSSTPCYLKHIQLVVQYFILKQQSKGFVIFVPSYKFLSNITSFIEKLQKFYTFNLIIDSAVSKFDELVQQFQYSSSQQQTILLTVFSGKFQQGVFLDFSFVQLILLVSIPFLPIHEFQIQEKMKYYGDSGTYWYHWQAFSKLQQIFFRASDQVSIFLVDQRYQQMKTLLKTRYIHVVTSSIVFQNTDQQIQQTTCQSINLINTKQMMIQKIQLKKRLELMAEQAVIFNDMWQHWVISNDEAYIKTIWKTSQHQFTPQQQKMIKLLFDSKLM
ncbi:Rad3-related DNA helicase [Spironucleus salmonicida]|uniref:Rad3-related DNA helicase n=2 Tax=Spironucleus salmonicida TaxID=348837 RepID=V6LKC1_9EUKA|nr:Rad3-related DNA helicase [Spironucleus salmonicida]|eukprot:EST45012.1 Rad3-related DNA helicase [Spironucleus salmonicida]